MALKIRMSRGGRKKRPFYAIVVADSRMPRDGRYLEKVGTYNPLLAKDDENRVTLNADRVKHWLGEGAQPSDRVAIFLGKAGIIDMPAQKNNPNKAKPKAAALQRVEDKKAKEEAKKEAEEAAKAEAEAAAAAEAEAPAEEAPAEETASEEAPAEAPAEEAPAEETASEEAPAEAPAEETASEEAPAEEEKKEEASA